MQKVFKVDLPDDLPAGLVHAGTIAQAIHRALSHGYMTQGQFRVVDITPEESSVPPLPRDGFCFCPVHGVRLACKESCDGETGETWWNVGPCEQCWKDAYDDGIDHATGKD